MKYHLSESTKRHRHIAASEIDLENLSSQQKIDFFSELLNDVAFTHFKEQYETLPQASQIRLLQRVASYGIYPYGNMNIIHDETSIFAAIHFLRHGIFKDIRKPFIRLDYRHIAGKVIKEWCFTTHETPFFYALAAHTLERNGYDMRSISKLLSETRFPMLKTAAALTLRGRMLPCRDIIHMTTTQWILPAMQYYWHRAIHPRESYTRFWEELENSRERSRAWNVVRVYTKIHVIPTAIYWQTSTIKNMYETLDSLPYYGEKPLKAMLFGSILVFHVGTIFAAINLILLSPFAPLLMPVIDTIHDYVVRPISSFIDKHPLATAVGIAAGSITACIPPDIENTAQPSLPSTSLTDAIAVGAFTTMGVMLLSY